MTKARQEPDRLALLLMRKRSLRGEKNCHEHGNFQPPADFHHAPPNSNATRCTVQNAPREPTVYPGTACAHRGQRTSSMRNERSSANIKPMKPSCPDSTPRLKETSASGSSCLGKPALVSALAKPKPCSSPNANATTQGWRIVKLVSPRHERTISGPRNRMLNAIAAFSGMTGTSAYPSVAMASVILCATVNAVTVFS